MKAAKLPRSSNYTEIFRELIEISGELCCIENCNKRATRICRVFREADNKAYLIQTCFNHKEAFHNAKQSFQIEEDNTIDTN